MPIQTTIPDYLVQQLIQGKGFNYRNAIVFDADEGKCRKFISLEYGLLDLIHDEMDVKYKVMRQELEFRSRKVFDILLVKLCIRDGAETKFYFDITQVFGL